MTLQEMLPPPEPALISEPSNVCDQCRLSKSDLYGYLRVKFRNVGSGSTPSNRRPTLPLDLAMELRVSPFFTVYGSDISGRSSWGYLEPVQRLACHKITHVAGVTYFPLRI